MMISYKDIGFYDSVVKDNEVWFVNAFYSAIFRFDLNTYDLKLEYLIPKEYSGVYKYANLVFYKNILIISPRNTNIILFYDINSKNLNTLTISEKYIPNGSVKNLILGIEIFNEYIYLFPGTCQAIIRISMKDKNIYYIDKWKEEISTSYNKNFVLFRHIERKDKKICYLTLFQHEIIMEFDLETEKWQFHKFEGNGACPLDIKKYDQFFLVSNKENTELVIWNYKVQERFFIPINKNIKCGIRDIICSDKFIYCIINTGDILCMLKKKDKKLVNIIQLKKDKKYTYFPIPQKVIMSNKYIDNKRELFSLLSSDKMAILYKDSGRLEIISPKLFTNDRDLIKAYIHQSIEIDIFHENHKDDLEELLELIKSANYKEKKQKCNDNIGKNILKKLKGIF